jgi:hypothetical protein
MSNSGYNPTTTADRSTTTSGVSHEDRRQILLDDLRVEIARLADAVERQNELLGDDGQNTGADAQ